MTSYTRKQVIQRAAGGAALLGAVPLLNAGPARAAAAAGGSIKLGWWGEQEAPGISAWVSDVTGQFKKATGTSVSTNLQDSGTVISGFTTAAAAGKPPDVQFFWNGIYHMENAWRGYIAPLNGLLPARLLANSNATDLSRFEGKQYRVGWYAIGFGIGYNRSILSKAGVNPDSPPKTWDAFLNVLDKIKSSGNAVPFGAGIKDGAFGESWLMHTLTQNLDSPVDALNLFIGKLDWREPRYHEHWVKLEELYKNKFFNDDVGSLDLFQGQKLWTSGKSAFSHAQTPLLPAAQKGLGKGNIGLMVMPVFGKGKMAGIPVADTQGFGIPAKAHNTEGAVAFLEFINQPAQLNSLWNKVHQIPANKTFNSKQINDPLFKAVYKKWFSKPANEYVPNLMPTLFWTDAMFVASQQILGGHMTGEQAGDLAYRITKKWKQQNPDLVEHYTDWAKDLKG